MAFKIALIVAVVCVAQGLALKIAPIPPCKPTHVSEEIEHDFEDAVHEMDEVRESISMAAMDSYMNKKDPRVVMACFQEQKESYVNLGKHIEELMEKAVEDMTEELGEKFDQYKELATEPMKNIANVLRELPVKTWELIKEEGFNKAFAYMRESRKIVEENSKKLGQVIRQMGEEFPEAAERAAEMAKEIRMEARKGSQAIAKAIEKCIEEGGPKKPEN